MESKPDSMIPDPNPPKSVGFSPGSWKPGGSRPEVATVRHFRNSRAAGGRVTAGHNEVLVGRAITGRRDEVQLATRFGIDRSGGDDKRVIRGEVLRGFTFTPGTDTGGR